MEMLSSFAYLISTNLSYSDALSGPEKYLIRINIVSW